MIGAAPLKEMVAATGARLLEGEEAWEADAVVVSGHRGFDYGELVTAKRALERGAALFATSHDPTMPYPGGELPGHRRGPGGGRDRLGPAGGDRRQARAAPVRDGDASARCSFRRIATKRNSEARVAMIGDRISSDIDGGRAAGLETILVLSGTTSREEAAAADPAPDFVLEDLSGLLA